MKTPPAFTRGTGDTLYRVVLPFDAATDLEASYVKFEPISRQIGLTDGRDGRWIRYGGLLQKVYEAGEFATYCSLLTARGVEIMYRRPPGGRSGDPLPFIKTWEPGSGRYATFGY